MTAHVEIPLGPEALAEMKAALDKRDEHALKLGIATAEYERAKRFFLDRISASILDEQRFAAAVIRDAGHDPNDGTWVRDGDKLVRR